MPLWYWVIVAALFILGFLGAASIGLPFFALALFLVLRGTVGRPRHDFWPPVVGIVLFFAAYILVAPLTCTLTPIPVTVGTPSDVEPQINPMTCTRIALPDYSGVDPPALWPSVVAAALLE